MLVALGSSNPAKRSAAESVVRRLWPDAQFTALKVDHGNAPQPLTREATIHGAIHRARLARNATGAQIGIGLEGGTAESEHGMLLELWAAASDVSGASGLGCGFSILLPEPLAAAVRVGEELGPAVDGFYHLERQNERGGLIEILTSGRLTRPQACETALFCALSSLTPHVRSPSE